MKDYMNSQKFLSKEQMKEAFIYGVVCTADRIFSDNKTRGSEFVVINEIVDGIYNGHFSDFGRHTSNGSIITRLGGAREVMFDIPCFREVYNISTLYEYEYSLSDIFDGKNLEEIIDIIEMAFEFRYVNPINFSDLEVRNAIKGYQTWYEQGKCLACWPSEETINKYYNKLCAEKDDNEIVVDSVMTSDTNIGIKNDRNDDASLIMQHPDYPDYKLMIVADGVGSCKRGDLAAKMFCEKMQEWFGKLSLDSFENNFNEKLENAIKCADKEIAQFNKDVGCYNVTVGSVVVITPQDTYYCTVGDTRIYFEYDEKLVRVERIENLHDKALKYDAYEKGLLPEDDGYNKERPEGYIGYGVDKFGLCQPVVNNISSDSYDGILMMSDGVYKEINDLELQVLFNECSPQDIASCIVERAAYGYIKNSSYEYLNSVRRRAGRDNITANVYKKVYQYNKNKVKDINL